MRVNFRIPCKVFSINKTYSRDMRFKSSEFRAWHSEVKARIEDCDEYKRLLELAEDAKKATKAELSIEIHVTYPHWYFYNKAGEISAKTIDVSNFEKGFIDLLVQDVLNLNDKLVTRLHSSKQAGVGYFINVQLELYTQG